MDLEWLRRVAERFHAPALVLCVIVICSTALALFGEGERVDATLRSLGLLAVLIAAMTMRR